MAKSIIMYGAGFEAKKRLEEWEAASLIPSCFADSDPGKQHLFIQGKKEFYEILPLHEAISRYPDYLLFITLLSESQESCRDYLLRQGISADIIRMADNVVYRRGCKFVDYNVQCSDGFKPCCNPRWTQTVAYSDNLQGNFEK